MHKPHPAACHALEVLVKALVLPTEKVLHTQHILPANAENCCQGPCLSIGEFTDLFH